MVQLRQIHSFPLETSRSPQPSQTQVETACWQQLKMSAMCSAVTIICHIFEAKY